MHLHLVVIVVITMNVNGNAAADVAITRAVTDATIVGRGQEIGLTSGLFHLLLLLHLVQDGRNHGYVLVGRIRWWWSRWLPAKGEEHEDEDDTDVDEDDERVETAKEVITLSRQETISNSFLTVPVRDDGHGPVFVAQRRLDVVQVWWQRLRLGLVDKLKVVIA